MTQPYGPGDPSIPEWTSPTGGGAPPPAPAPGAPPPPTMPPSASPRPGTAGPTPTYRSWQPGIMPLRPMTFGDFLSFPFRAMRYNRAVVVGGPLTMTLLTLLATGLAVWVLVTDPSFDAIFSTTATSYPAPRGETILALIVAALLWLLTDALSRAIVAPGVSRAILGERITLGQAWSALRSRFWRIVGLYAVATAFAAIAVVALVLFIGLATLDPSGGAVAGLIIIVLPLAIATALVYQIGMGVAAPMIVLERGGVFASIRRTFRLLRGRFWWTVLIAFVAGILVNIASQIVQFAGQIAVIAVSAIAPDNVGLLIAVGVVIVALAVVVSSILTYSYLGSTFAFVYVDLRIRHEGFDVDLAEAAEARARR